MSINKEMDKEDVVDIIMEYYESVTKRNKIMSFAETWIDLDFAIQSDFPRSSVGKESVCSAGDPVSIPGSGRSAGEGNGNPLQYPCLENPMDRGAWQAKVHGSQELDIT